MTCFLERYCVQNGMGLKVLEKAAAGLLIESDWLGNVRQLLDTVQSLVSLSQSSFVSRIDVEKYLNRSNAAEQSKPVSEGGLYERHRSYESPLEDMEEQCLASIVQ